MFVEKYQLEAEDHQARFSNMHEIEPAQFQIRVHETFGRILHEVLSGCDSKGMIREYMVADGLASAYNGPFINI